MVKPTTQMVSKDCDIRAALRARLRKRYAGQNDIVVVEELPVCRGTVRTDLAIVSERIEGIEIKSAADTLERLPWQAELFSAALNRITLVVAPRHLEAALQIIPGWWTVCSAEKGARGGIKLRRVRPGKDNPRRTAEGVASLLERDELVGVLARLGRDKGWCSKPAYRLIEHIQETLSLEQITAGACKQLKLRAYLEKHYETTAFGRTAFGGGLSVIERELDELREARTLFNMANTSAGAST